MNIFENLSSFDDKNNAFSLQKTSLSNDLIDETIVRFDDRIGSYGMGGPGFFGLKLSNKHQTMI